MQQTSCGCATRFRARSTKSIPCLRARWFASSSSTPTMTTTPQPRKSAGEARVRPDRLAGDPEGRPRLGGPAHGAPNEAALKTLGEIGTVNPIPEFIKRAKEKKDGFLLMGFGHRVYNHYDPPAKIMEKTC